MRSGWVFALIYMYNYEIVLKYAVYGTVDQIAQEEGPPWSPTDLAFSSPPLKVPAHVVSKSTPGVILLFKQKIRYRHFRSFVLEFCVPRLFGTCPLFLKC